MMNTEIWKISTDISFLIGDQDTVAGMPNLAAMEPFSDRMLDMLNDVSRLLMAEKEAREYPDVVTFAFWIRKASALKLKERFHRADGNLRLGRGLAFHIAPSNVPVNFAYSLAAGFLTGNANIVRVPSKSFPQVRIIAGAFARVLLMEKNRNLAKYVCLVKYGKEKEVNDLFSSIADTRIIWGGDVTVEEIRKSPLAPRAGEVTFADRFSIAVIDSNAYMEMDDKDRVAEDFYNDTYLTDQNACTSPRLVAWMGNRREEAKDGFWGRLHELVKRKYLFQPIQGVEKLMGSCLAAVMYGAQEEEDYLGDGAEHGLTASDTDRLDIISREVESGVRIEPHTDNLLVRVKIPRILDGLMERKGNSGYFLEYDCGDIMELKGLCSDRRCQTVAYIGDAEMVKPLLTSGIRGIDRVVPVGRTMDFDLIWDGYDLYGRLTRVIAIE